MQHRLKKSWPGGYAFNGAGQLVYVPRAHDLAEGERVLPAPPLRILGALCKPGDVVVDVGAGLGLWTLEAARLVGAHGRVVAVEPAPQVAQALRRSTRANRLASVTVLVVALAEAGGRRPFSVALGHASGSRFGMVEGDGARAFSPIAVHTARLDDLVREQGLARLDLLRLDVAGFEPDVLAGGAETLARFRPALLLECGHEEPRRRQRTAEMLERAGYEVLGVVREDGVLDATLGEYAARRGPFAGAAVLDLLLMPTELP